MQALQTCDILFKALILALYALDDDSVPCSLINEAFIQAMNIPKYCLLAYAADQKSFELLKGKDSGGKGPQRTELTAFSFGLFWLKKNHLILGTKKRQQCKGFTWSLAYSARSSALQGSVEGSGIFSTCSGTFP